MARKQVGTSPSDNYDIATKAYVDNAVATGGATSFSDSVFTIQNNTDSTKKLKFSASGITTATTRTLTVPNVDGTIITTGDTGTVTNTMLAGSIALSKLAAAAYSTTPTASILAQWDANKNLSSNAFIPGFTTTATAAGTTTLTIASTQLQEFTGTTTQTVKLPTASIVAGAQYTIVNNSTGAVTVQSSGANTISTLAAGTTATFTAMTATPSTAAHWDSTYVSIGGDFSSNTATSVDGEVVLFSGTGGKTGKRATGSGIATLTSGVLGTVTAPSGTIVGTTDTQTLTNKTLTDSTTYFQDDLDNTKKLQFQLSGITTATTRTLTVPNVNGTIITTGDTGTVTNTMLAGSITLSKLSTTGTASSTTYLRGDGAWSTVDSLPTQTGNNGKYLTTDGTTASWAAISAGGAGSFVQQVGDGVNSTITVTHNLNTRNVIISVKDSATYTEVNCDKVAATLNTVTLGFGSIPTTNQYYVTIIADGVPTVSNNTSSIFVDNVFTIRDDVDNTKQLQFQVSGVSTGTTRTLTVPNVNGTIITTGDTGTVTNTMLAGSITLSKLAAAAYNTTPTASILAQWDANKNLSANALIPGFTTTATAAGTTTLTIASTQIQEFTGSTTQTVKLPTTSVVAGAQYTIVNNSTGAVTVQSSGSNTISTLAAGTTATFTAVTATPTTAANWDSTYNGDGDFSSNTATSVDGEVVLFSGTGGKTGKRATGSGIATLTSGVLGTVTAPSGTIVGTTDTQTLTNKTLTDSTTYFQDETDNTKKLQFQLSGITTATTRTLTVPDANTTIVGTDATQTLTNKTLTNPTVTNYTESVVAIGTVTTSNTLSLTNGTVQTATLTASTACTFTMPTATAGKSFVLMLKQAATTGNGTATFTSVKWGSAGAPTITATAGSMDILSFFSDGTNWYGSIAQGYTP